MPGFFSAWRVSARSRARAYMQQGVPYRQTSDLEGLRRGLDELASASDQKISALWDTLRKAEQQHAHDLKAIHEAVAQPANGGISAVRNLALQLALTAHGRSSGVNPMELVDTARRFHAFLQGDA